MGFDPFFRQKSFPPPKKFPKAQEAPETPESRDETGQKPLPEALEEPSSVGVPPDIFSFRQIGGRLFASENGKIGGAFAFREGDYATVGKISVGDLLLSRETEPPYRYRAIYGVSQQGEKRVIGVWFPDRNQMVLEIEPGKRDWLSVEPDALPNNWRVGVPIKNLPNVCVRLLDLIHERL